MQNRETEFKGSKVSSGHFSCSDTIKNSSSVASTLVSDSLTYSNSQNSLLNSSQVFKNSKVSYKKDKSNLFTSKSLSASYVNSKLNSENINVKPPINEKDRSITTHLQSPISLVKKSFLISSYSDLFSKTIKDTVKTTYNQNARTNSLSEFSSNVNNLNIFSMNKSNGQTDLYKSVSSKFICSKCGLGYPCTLFLCKRSKLSFNPTSEKAKSQVFYNTVKNENINNNLFDSSKSEDKSSQIVYHVENISTVELEKTNCSSSTENIVNLITQVFSEDVGKVNATNKENNISTQNHGEVADFKVTNDEDITIAKPIFTSSKIDNTFQQEVSEKIFQGSNDVKLHNFTMSSTDNFEVKINNETALNKHNPIKSFAALSEEASKFLNELNLSGTESNTFNADTSYNVPASSQNEMSIPESCSEAHSASNCQIESCSSSAITNSSNIDVVKDVTNALDFIEQSSLYDQNLSSAEICNSLNQIFNENGSSELQADETNSEIVQPEELQSVEQANTDEIRNSLNEIFNENGSSHLSVDETNSAIIQSEESQSAEQTNILPLLIDNESEVITVEQAVESEDYINSNNVQSILLIQDASGNIETVYLLEDNLNKEGAASLIQSLTNNGENILLPEGFKVDLLQNQCTAYGENIFVNVSDQVPNLASENAPATSIATESEIKNQILLNSRNSQNNLDNESFVMQDINITSVMNISDGDMSKLIYVKNIEETTDNKSVEMVKHENNIKNINTTSLEKEKLETAKENLKFEKQLKNDIIVIDSDIEESNISNSLNVPRTHTSSETNKEILNSNLNNLDENSKNTNSENNSFGDKEFLYKSSPDFHKINGDLINNVDIDYDSKLINKDVSENFNKITEEEYPYVLKALQKSKKSLSCKEKKRTAKKSSFYFSNKSNYQDPHLDITSNSFDTTSLLMNGILDNNPDYSELNNLILKRKIESINNHIFKRTKIDESDILNNRFNNCKSNTRFMALKTFKKPFTAAKKSLTEYKENMPKVLKNKALKSFTPKTALKSVKKNISEVKQDEAEEGQVLSTNLNEKVDTGTSSNLNFNQQLTTYIQPEISEIRLVPNECLKRVTNLLQNPPHTSDITLDDNVSEDDEIKFSSRQTSPIEEFVSQKPFCTCSALEVPCICNDYNLQLICEGEDSINDSVIPCTRNVSKQYLLTPSSEVRYRAFCDIHLARLRKHHCCPKCGIFCSQGKFMLCLTENIEQVEDHLFHYDCFLIPSPGLPPACPHCCKFSEFKSVSLIYMAVADDENKEVPSNSKNITSELDCNIFMTIDPICKQDVVDSALFLPEKNDIKIIIAALAKEKSLRLRPTGKCLYNPIKTGDVQKVMQLIANGVNPNHKFRMHSNNSPIHVAAYYGWIGILHILLQAGAQIDSVNDDLETALIVAVERNHLHIVRYLILAGAQIDVKDCNGMTSFHIASKNGFKEIAEFLYDTGLVDINLQDDGGWTPLVWACEYKHVDFVKWLLNIGADPNVRDSEENTGLHWAAYSGKSEIAELLLEKGCTLSYVNKRGDSALHIAARENNYDCVKLFVSKGAVLDLKNKENKNPLQCCEDGSLSWNFLCQCISSGTLKIGKTQLEKHVVFRDISRGAEAYPIQAINEVDDEEFIMEFRYIVKNCHRSGVDIVSTVNQMLFCYCTDNCLTRDCHCFLNSKCWYDANGCLTSEFELLSPPVIFECNKTCHCPKTCINRVVQQGLRCPLQLFRTKYQGWGVRTLQDLRKGAFVCEYVGELITGAEALKRDDDTYFFDLESKDSDYCLDGRYYGNVARFINHSCEPNLMAVKVFVDHQDLNFPRIAFFALRSIKAFEELCFDYGLDFWIVKSQSILCTCNSQSCKYSKDTIDETLEKFFKDTES